MSSVNYNVVNYPVKVVKKNEYSFLVVGEHQLILPKLPVFDDNQEESVSGTISFESGFEVKYSGKDKMYMVDGDISVGRLVLNLADEVVDSLLDDPRFMDNGQYEVFDRAILHVVNEKLQNGDMDSQLTRDGSDWDDEEEQVALEIYINSANGQDSAAMKTEIDKAINDGKLSRSYNSIKMKVYCYQAVDQNVGVDGLANISKKTKETFQRYKASLSVK